MASNNNSGQQQQQPPASMLDRMFPTWARNQQWRETLASRAAHRAMDIPEDVQISTTNNKSGIGPLGVIGIALAAGVAGPLAMWGMNQWNKPATVHTVQTMPAPANPPAGVQKDGYWREEDYDPATGEIKSVTHYRSRSGIVERLMPDNTWQAVPGMPVPNLASPK